MCLHENDWLHVCVCRCWIMAVTVTVIDPPCSRPCLCETFGPNRGSMSLWGMRGVNSVTYQTVSLHMMQVQLLNAAINFLHFNNIFQNDWIAPCQWSQLFAFTFRGNFHIIKKIYKYRCQDVWAHHPTLSGLIEDLAELFQFLNCWVTLYLRARDSQLIQHEQNLVLVCPFAQRI